MYILYGGGFTRALIVEMVLAEGGIPYELRNVDIVAHEHRKPEYLAINPFGWVPALITPEGRTLYETPAINLYLAERHELTHLAPALDDPERGLFLSGLFSVTGDLEPILKRSFYPHRYVMREEDTAAMEERALAEALERLRVMEGRLRDNGPLSPRRTLQPRGPHPLPLDRALRRVGHAPGLPRAAALPGTRGHETEAPPPVRAADRVEPRVRRDAGAGRGRQVRTLIETMLPTGRKRSPSLADGALDAWQGDSRRCPKASPLRIC